MSFQIWSFSGAMGRSSSFPDAAEGYSARRVPSRPVSARRRHPAPPMSRRLQADLIGVSSDRTQILVFVGMETAPSMLP